MINNPRFPHQVTISRIEGASSFDSGEETFILVEAPCRNYRNTVTKNKGGVIMSDYTIAIASLEVEIMANDLVEVNEGIRTIKGRVVEMQKNNLGANIWWNKVDN